MVEDRLKQEKVYVGYMELGWLDDDRLGWISLGRLGWIRLG